jgi:hypothetical protein
MSRKSADLTAAYMAKRPLAMCNQLTGCGKPISATDEVIEVKAFLHELAQFKRNAEFGKWVNW